MRLPPFPLHPKLLAAFVHDLTMTAIAVVVCYAVRFEVAGLMRPWVWEEIALVLAVMLPSAAIVYWLLGLYTGIWRFASIPDLLKIVKAVTLLTMLMALLDFASRGEILVPRSVVLAFWFVLCVLLGGPRMLYRIYRDGRIFRRERQRRAGIPALIAGTGHEAEVIIRSLETSDEAILPVGLVAAKHSHIGQQIRGIRVLGHLDDLESIVDELTRAGTPPRRLIVTNEALTREEGIEDFIAEARKRGLNAERLSRANLEQAEASGRLSLAPIRIEDLLGRSTRDLDYGMIREMIGGRRVLVTGGGGTVGSELCRQIAGMSCLRLMIVENSEFALYEITRTLQRQFPGVPVDGRLCDVRDRRHVTRLVESFRPDFVFHAAALKHVPIVENNIPEGIRTNTIGTANVADAARRGGAKAMILISTDKAVQPISVMGATKRAAECYCEALDTLAFASGNAENVADGPTRFMSVRFGNVLGSSGSVVPLFQEQLEQGGPITVTHPDMTRYFMTLKEAVSLVLMASALGLNARDRISLFVLDMGEPVRIVDLARRMIRLAGLEPDEDIRIEFTGVRDGEKLHEELFDSAEALRPTELKGILAAESRAVVSDVMARQVEALKQALSEDDETVMLERLGAIVPEFASGRVH